MYSTVLEIPQNQFQKNKFQTNIPTLSPNSPQKLPRSHTPFLKNNKRDVLKVLKPNVRENGMIAG